jgi:hypothetical protein
MGAVRRGDETLKKCTSCAKDLPDTAMHCVFCGAKQAPAPAPQANPNAKTVMGYAAADLLKQAGIQPGGPPAAAPQAFAPPAAPPQQFQPPPQQFQPPPQQFQPPPQQFQPPPQQFQPPPQQFQPPPQAPQGFPPPQAPQQFQPPGGGGFQPQGGFPPPAQGGQFGGSASTAATMFMQNAPPIAPQPPQPPPPSYQPPPPQASYPQMPQQPMHSPYPPPPGGMPGGMPAPQPYNPQPVGGMPPYLASQTAARANKPIEPFNDITKLALLVFGGCLLAYLVVPLTLSPFHIMAEGIADFPGKMKLIPLLIAAGGVGGVLLGVMPMTPMARGGIAALVGLIPILLFATVVFGFDWHTLVYPMGGILVPAGLLLRDAYPTDKLPRMFVFAGAACIALPFFVPFRVVDMVLDILKSIIHPGILLTMLAGFIPLLLSALAVILCVIPGQFKFGAKQLAWAWFLFPFPFMIASLAVNSPHMILDIVTHAPGMLFAWAGPAIPTSDVTGNASFAMPLYTGFAAMATFGVVTLFGKQLEMSK